MKEKFKYEVTLGNEYNPPVDFWVAKDKYTKWFDTLAEAKKYASSIKNELKQLFRGNPDYKDNVIIIEVNKYWYDPEDIDEQFMGLWHSLNIVGKY